MNLFCWDAAASTLVKQHELNTATSLGKPTKRDFLLLCGRRQLNLALGVLQAGMAVVLLLAMEAGAVLPGVYAWAHVAAGAAGAVFCCVEAAAPGLQQELLLQIAVMSAAGTPIGSAMGSLHLSGQQELPQQQHTQQRVSVTQLHNGDVTTAWSGQPGAAAACHAQAKDAAWMNTTGSTTDSELPLPLSSMQWESVEHADSRYAQVMQATVLLLTLLQLAL